jgi:ADP-ribose pyrophosphatase YjhB (NUDIX family)
MVLAGTYTVGTVTGAMSGEPGRWRTFGEREVYRSPELWLGQVDVEPPGRSERIWEHVVRLHQVALMALVDGQSRVLLVWRHRFVADRWGWELPGGLVDEGEDPAEAALRMVEDTAGYGAGTVERLITFQPMAETVACEHVVFVGRDPERVGDPAEAEKVVRVEWVPLVSVPGLIAAEQIWNAGTLVALLRLLTMDGQAVPR